jgi:hypothetical protein
VHLDIIDPSITMYYAEYARVVRPVGTREIAGEM